MSTRYRWYKIHIPGGVEFLQQDLTGRPFDMTSETGFLHLQKLENESRFRFFFRSTLVVTKVDEFGGTTFEEVSTIRFSDFALLNHGKNSFLRIENPGLNVKTLLNTIELHTGLGFSCKPITFRFKRFNNLFRDIEAKKLIGLKVADAVVEIDVVARMEFSSKKGIVTDNIRALSEIKYNIESAQYEIIHEGISGQVSYTTKGIVKVCGQLAPLIVQLIERDLSAFVIK